MTRKFVFTIAYLCTYTGYAQHTAQLENLYYQGDYAAVTNILVDDELLEPEAFYVIANAFHKLEDFESALIYYDLASEKAHELKDYFLNRAICEISSGDLESAERNLFMYEDQVGQHPMVYYYFAAIDFQSQELKTGFESIEIAIELSPEYWEAWYLKGAILVEQDKYEKAKECFTRVLEIFPDHERSKLNLAMTYIHTKEYDAAFEILEYIINNNNDLKAEALYYRAEANFYLHNMDQACEDWSKSSALGDEFSKRNIKLICEKGKILKHKVRKVTKITL